MAGTYDPEKAKVYRLAHREKRMAQSAAWRKAHPEKVHAYQIVYRVEHAEVLRTRSKTYYDTHAEERRAASAVWRATHPEEARMQLKAYRLLHRAALSEKARLWRETHAEKIRLYGIAWRVEHSEEQRAWTIAYRAAHPEKVRAWNKNRKARRRGAPVRDFTAAQWQDMQAAYDHRCVYCGKRAKGKLTQDHITPVSQGGAHTLANIVPACRSCNSRKHTGAPLIAVQPLLLCCIPQAEATAILQELDHAQGT